VAGPGTGVCVVAVLTEKSNATFATSLLLESLKALENDMYNQIKNFSFFFPNKNINSHHKNKARRDFVMLHTEIYIKQATNRRFYKFCSQDPIAIHKKYISNRSIINVLTHTIMVT
jgi:hypothetical protein